VEKVVSQRDESRNPLFDILFQLENIDIPEIKVEGLQSKPYTYNKHAAKFDMTFFGVELKDQLFFVVEYCTKLYKKETIQWFADCIREIISTIVENPDCRISDISVGSEVIGYDELSPFTENLENE
jgi:hypothetical protein